MTSVQLINPATEDVISATPLLDEAATFAQLGQAHESFQHWRKLDMQTRLQCVHDFEESLHAARITLAEQISREMGKVLKESLGELDKCVASCKTLRERFPIWKEEREYSEGSFSVHHEPLGVVVGIMPWNFPVWQVVRFAIPALLCGNAVLLKHAPNTFGVAEFLGDLFQQAFPHAVYSNTPCDVQTVQKLVADPRVRGVSLTGSRAAGSSVGELAGRHLKKCVLELGGSDAYVILDDANVERAAEVCAKGRLVNAGQSCVAAKRFIVTKKNASAFAEALRAQMQAVQYGDPLLPRSEIGPLARKDLRATLHDQVQKALGQGAKLILGGELPARKGYFYPPTVLTQVVPGQVAFDEELFGPVAAVIEARDEAEAFALANRSRYGLGGGVFSRDVERARRLALEELDCGMAFVNDFVRSDARVPFGGVKDSGLGRELGREGSFEFTNVKTIYSHALT